MRAATAVFGLLYVTSISTAAPQERFSFGNMINGIVNAVSGQQYDSPPYELIATHGELEERRYEGGKYWACVKKEITDTDGDRGMFMTLFRYIQGANQGDKSISMTSPVSMNMSKKGIDNSFSKEMCFFLDSSHQSNPPQPTDPAVYLAERPAMTVYTRKVGGYMNNDDWFAESETLDEMIREKGFQVNQDYFFANGYDSPMKFWNRRNEVWKVKSE